MEKLVINLIRYFSFYTVFRANGSELSVQYVSENEPSSITCFAGIESVSFYEFHKVNLNNEVTYN